MARRVFFSFHYQRDIWRAAAVRNTWLTKKAGRESAGFWDAANWESVKRGGDTAIKRWIEEQLNGTSTTVVLIGSQTASRKYVLHEIRRSAALGKGLLGVRIHNKKDQGGLTDVLGNNPFDSLHVAGSFGLREALSTHVSTYDYVLNSGYENLGSWIESAAASAVRRTVLD